MVHARRKLILSAAALAAVSLAATTGMAAGTSAKPHGGEVYRGKAVSIGKGIAQVVVRTDQKGQPRSVAIMLTRGVLQGLPTRLNKKNKEGEWDYFLPMPAKAPNTGYTHVVVDWNPHGHPPPHVYTVPHFDFHFYVMSPEDVGKVAFSGPKDPAAAVTDDKLVPQGYKVIPDTVVDKMGVHAVDLNAPEFKGKPFTTTFIYGYYKNQLTFVEPMITRAYLNTKPNITQTVAAPAKYSIAGFYPTSYSVRYVPRWKSYFVSLDHLRKYSGMVSGSNRP